MKRTKPAVVAAIIGERYHSLRLYQHGRHSVATSGENVHRKFVWRIFHSPQRKKIATFKDSQVARFDGMHQTGYQSYQIKQPQYLRLHIGSVH